jgi:hypothetical protein
MRFGNNTVCCLLIRTLFVGEPLLEAIDFLEGEEPSSFFREFCISAGMENLEWDSFLLEADDERMQDRALQHSLQRSSEKSFEEGMGTSAGLDGTNCLTDLVWAGFGVFGGCGTTVSIG